MNKDKYDEDKTIINNRRITSYDKTIEPAWNDNQANAFEEYMRFSNSNILRCSVNPMTNGYLANKSDKDQWKYPWKTERGLFSNNERISSRKQFFRNIRESLNKDSLECSKSTIYENELISNTNKNHYSKIYESSDSSIVNKHSLNSKMTPSNSVGRRM